MKYLTGRLYKIHRLYRSEFFIVSILLIALLVIFFKEPIFNHKVLAPTQILSNIMPFARDCGMHCPGVNFYWLDPVIAFNPWLKFQRDELQQGRLPLWNPWIGAGLPHLGNGSSAIFFPLHSLFYLFDFKFALLINAFLKLYLAGLFTYCYLRKLRLSPPASFFGAIAYMFCGFQIVWLSFAMTNISMLLPALFYLVERATEQKYSPQIYLLLALAWAIQFLVGHPQLSLVVISTTSLYFIFKLGYYYRVHPRIYPVLQHGLAFGGAGFLGVSLAAIQLVPFT